jgi:SAM-dependent methyltransferase
MDRRDLREQNRLSWNAVVGAHDSHRGDLSRFFSEGGSTLFQEERDLLGELEGRSLVHLQCNAGSDSISLARLGARVTGVDLSDEAVSSARFLICWLPDLRRWAWGIASILNPGGRFVLIDFHPAADIFDRVWNHVSDYPCGGKPLLLEVGVDDYVAASGGGLTPAGFVEGVRDFENPEGCYLFRWGLGEVVTALAEAGLRITALEEYPYANGERKFAGMRELPGRRMVPPEHIPTVPLMYSIRAEKG